MTVKAGEILDRLRRTTTASRLMNNRNRLLARGTDRLRHDDSHGWSARVGRPRGSHLRRGILSAVLVIGLAGCTSATPLVTATVTDTHLAGVATGYSAQVFTETATATNSDDARYLGYQKMVMQSYRLAPLPEQEALRIAHRVCSDAQQSNGHSLAVIDDTVINESAGLGPRDTLINVIVDLAAQAARVYCPKYTDTLQLP